MKRIIITGLMAASSFFLNGQVVKKTSGLFDAGIILNKDYSRGVLLDSIMKLYTTRAMPGLSMAVFTESEGWWASAHGFANVEKEVPMMNNHLQYLQSVTKTYMAVVIMQLKEQGKIDLDAPITNYLPVTYSRFIKEAQKITVRMLLNHRSGIPEYNDNTLFVSQVIEHPLRNFSAMDCLKHIANESLKFTPGSQYLYTNTNYLLLSLIADRITGNHAAYIQQHIFKKLGLQHSYYGNNYSYLKGLNLPQSYWDVFNNGKPVNISNFQQMTVVSSKGDDGIVCTTTDAIKFLKGLMEGLLLKSSSIAEMLDFVKDEKGNKRYGMGLSFFDLGGIEAYGHGGGGIGAGCGLLYFPSHKMYVFFATNLGVLVEGELVKKAGEFRDAMLATLLM